MGNQSNRALLSDYLLGQQSSSFGRNYVLNPSGFENVNNISISGSATVTRNTTTPLTAISDLSVSLPNDTSSGVTWTLNTLDNSLNGQNCMLSFDYTSSSLGSAVQAQVLQGSNISATVTLNPASTPKNVILNTPCGNLGSATTVVITNVTGNSGSSALHVANVNYGKATNIGTVAQAQAVLSVNTSSTALAANTPTIPVFTNVVSDTLSGYDTSTGVYTVKAPGDYEITMGVSYVNLPTVYVKYLELQENSTAQFQCEWDASAGANEATQTFLCHGLFKNVAIGATLNGIAEQQTGSSISLNGAATQNFLYIKYYPTQSQLAVNSNLIFNPQVTVYTSGSGTYTVPNGTAYLEVEMVGGGGGGGGSGTTNSGGTGGNGGASTFGSLISCPGGTAGGSAYAGVIGFGGVTPTITSPATTLFAVAGGNGGPGINVSAVEAAGGIGGSSYFGGAGTSQAGGLVGQPGQTNTGGGGGGGGSGGTAAFTGTGGGAGSSAQAIIIAPASSYSYSVGAAGTAGAAGPSGFSGAIGGSGIIIVTAYPAQNAPILVGSVTSSGSGQYHSEYVIFGGSGSYTSPTNCSVSNCTIYAASNSSVAVQNTGAGTYSVTFPTGVFSGPYACSGSGISAGSGTASLTQTSWSATESSFQLNVNEGGAIGDLLDAYGSMICMGPH